MVMKLYGHPFSSCTWKGLIPFYACDIPVELRMIREDERENGAFVAKAFALTRIISQHSRSFPRIPAPGVPLTARCIRDHSAGVSIPSSREVARPEPSNKG